MREKSNYSRRDFLKVVGAAAGATAASGCKPDVPEKLVPYVIQPSELVPGVSAYYSGSCDQCSAGCGWEVRTREGRALKVEGKADHPVNKGGLCVRAQSSLQELYDPDRVREPLFRDLGSNAPLKPISWADALKKLADAIAGMEAGKELAILSKPRSGSEVALLREFANAQKNSQFYVYDESGADVVQVACEETFGPGVELDYDLSKAEVVVGLGADYLETFVSPVKYSREWADKRSPERNKQHRISYVYHIEPRLSLTAANADSWIKNAPGSESAILLAILAGVMAGRASSLSTATRNFINRLLVENDVSAQLDNAGISKAKIKEIVQKLTSASSSVVIAGGAACAGKDGIFPLILSNLINLALGNIGKSLTLIEKNDNRLVDLSGADALSSRQVARLLKRLEDKKVGVLITSGVNPAYSLPASSNYPQVDKLADFRVAITTKLDETARLANLVLPLSVGIEAWNDGEIRPGVYNLSQPAMQPVFSSQGFGDTILALAGQLGHDFSKAKSFKEYIEKRFANLFPAEDFVSAVQNGGVFKEVERSVKRGPAQSIYNYKPSALAHKGIKQILGFPTVKSTNGETANRPWVQELPDPINTSVWGSYAEIHPSLAKDLGALSGDLIQLKTEHGAFEVPAIVTENVHPDLVAIPTGGGHTDFGRFGTDIGVNVNKVLAGSKDVLTSKGFQKVAQLSGLRRALAKNQLVTTQQFHEQFDRGILRSVSAKELEKQEHQEHGNGGEHGEKHAGGHHDPLALGPQEQAPQMYHQMRHPVYRWGMSVDLASCTGCSACVVACYAENNIATVGKELVAEGREMAWIRISRFDSGKKDRPISGFQPMMCQHCNDAPCEPVCPVYATYHNEQGLNHMVYNRCVGTRYCSNNCSYKVRRFNWFRYSWPEPMNWQLNPDVTVREVGVMEKCTFCVQRIRAAENTAKNEGRLIKDGEVKPACASSCPTKAITFGNLLDEKSEVAKKGKSPRGYKVIDAFISTQPAITYLARVTHDEAKAGHHGKPAHGDSHAGEPHASHAKLSQQGASQRAEALVKNLGKKFNA